MSTITVSNEVMENNGSKSVVQVKIESIIDDLMASLPNPQQLTSEERRGIIARYSSVLEGNFIYWMTATLIVVKTEEAREELVENLHEEVKDAHPDMLRRFAMAAHSFPTDQDALASHEEVTKVRKFLGRLSPVQSLASMAFFEGAIQRFMPFLATLAAEEGSTEMEYTDVHGFCDIAHTEGLYRAFAAEMEANPLDPGADLLEGVHLLQVLFERIVRYRPAAIAA
ncbi:MAG TPA: iron-containing redox enzyme family protein [Terracidiphilus sp.]|jgi:uncharacterized protein YdiU (UPF0061 family)|nr:iron-containing redox enzyme family protein [Terracidiphilus sp.]